MAKIENGRQSADTRSIRTISSSHTHLDDESSLGSDSEINGFTSDRQTDKYGFIGGAQQYSEESAQDVPTEVLRQREVKWLDMLNHWDKWMVKRHSKVRLRCQKGIPPALRGRAWLYLSGGKVKREQNQGKFQELDSEPGDPKWLDVIEKDLHRQFPFHEMFVSRGGHGQQDLFRVLKAYTLYRPEEGYCQAQAPIAAVLLMHMPAEDAFWGLVQICEKYLPGYYSPGLEAIQLDGEILYALLRRVCPLAYRHLEKHKIEPILYMTEWFMCAFSRTLPWASVLRVWDMFLCDGVKIIFRVGLVLLKCMMGTREKLKACQGQYETMELLKAIEPRYIQEGFLVREVVEVPVSERDVEKENHSQLKRWRKNRGELNFKSPPRLHGARAVMLAEPPSRQDLRQNPTIIVEPPQPIPQLKKAEERKSKKEEEKRIKEEKKNKKRSLKKSSQPIKEIPNPYPLPSLFQPLPAESVGPLPVISETPLDLPDTVRELPLQDLPETVRELPLQDLPETVRELPLQDLPETVSDLPPQDLPETVSDLPPQDLPQIVRDLPPQDLPQIVRDLPPQDLPQIVRDLPPQDLPQLVTDLPPQDLPQTMRDILPQDLPPQGLPQTVRDLPPLDLPQTVRDLPPQDLPQTVRDLPPQDLPQLVTDLPQIVRDIEPQNLPETVKDVPPQDLPETVRDLPPQDLPQTARDIPPQDLPQLVTDLPPQVLPHTVTESPAQQPSHKDPCLAKESPLQHSTQSLSSTEQDTYL